MEGNNWIIFLLKLSLWNNPNQSPDPDPDPDPGPGPGTGREYCWYTVVSEEQRGFDRQENISRQRKVLGSNSSSAD